MSSSAAQKIRRLWYAYEAANIDMVDYIHLGGAQRFIAERMGEEEPYLLRMLGKVPDEVLKTGPKSPGLITPKALHTYETDALKTTKPMRSQDLSQVERRQRIAARRRSAIEPNVKATPFKPTRTPIQVFKKGKVYYLPEVTENVKVNTFWNPKTGKQIVLQKQWPALGYPKYNKVSKRRMYRIQKMVRDYTLTSEKLSLEARMRLVSDVKGLIRYGSNALKSPWGKKAIGIGLSIAFFNVASSTIHKVFHRNDSKAIPDEYERGYDVIKESMTDFGSPLNLSKAAQKVIMPYYSTVRKATKTNVFSVINSNQALASSRSPIRHTRY